MAFFSSPGFQNQFITPPIQDPTLAPSWNTSLPYSYANINSSNPYSYGGPNPYQSSGQQGFFSGLNQLTNPFYNEPRFGNPTYNNRDAIDSVSTRPLDATVWAGQRLIAPALAFGAAFKTLGPATAGGYFTGGGVGGALGKGLASGLTRGALTGLGVSGRVAGVAAAGAGVAGSIVGALGLPSLAAYAALEAGQKLVFNPYINTRQAGQDLMSNFEGVTFGDARGNVATGGGLSYKEAYGMASNLTRRGMQDMTFSGSEYTQIADLTARSGLLDTANSKQITDRIKGIADQIKMVMAISKDPSFKNAIEEISKLQFAGANAAGGMTSQAITSYMDIGRSATMAGTTIQRLMGVVGSQGQSLYQNFGMTPYLGQLAAANIYSSFAGGQREGLVSPSHLARLGGLENATQSALGGQVQGGRSTLMQMALYNKYFGGAGGNAVPGSNMNMTSVIGTFGQNFGKNPMGTMGRMAMYGDQMIALDIKQNGGMGLEGAIASYAKNLPLKRNADGQFNAEDIIPVMMSMGMSRDQIDAFLTLRANQTNPDVVKQQMAGSGRFTEEQLRQYVSQNSLYGGAAGTAYRNVVKGWKGFSSRIGGVVGDATAALVGEAGDNVQSMYDSFMFGKSLGTGTYTKDASTMFNQTASQSFSKVKLMNSNGFAWGQAFESKGFGNQLSDAYKTFTDSSYMSASDARKLGNKINTLAKSGNTNALAYLAESDPHKKGVILQSLISANQEYFGDEGRKLNNPDSPGTFTKFVNASQQLQTVDFSPEKTGTGTTYEKALDSVTGMKNAGSFYNLKAIGSAANIMAANVGDGSAGVGNITELLKDPKNAALAQAVGKYSTPEEAWNKVKGIFQKGAESGLATMGIEADKMDPDAIAKDPTLIRNPAIRKQYIEAQKQGDKNGVERALTENLSDSLGGMTTGRRLANASKIDIGSTVGELSLDVQDADKRKQLQSQLKQGLIDYSGFQNSMNAMDMQQSTKIFGDAVTKFSDAVDKMPGSASATPASSDSGGFNIGPWHFGPSNQRSNTSGGQ
jgi:hypothetical protein